MRPIGVGLVGYGYWGPNLARNLSDNLGFRLLGLCEVDEARANRFARHYAVPVVGELDALLAQPGLEAVLIATPPYTHREVAGRALQADKHVLVEKPLAMRTADALELIALSQERGLVLMPGHTFVYSPRVQRIKQLLDDGLLGEPYFITSSRMNLGRYQPDGVVYDLAPHDLSILLYCLDQPVVQVTASGVGVLRNDVPETAFLTVLLGRTPANIQLSWLAPRKVRQMVIVGSKRMIYYEDTASEESVRVYDRGIELSATPASFHEYQATYRTGDMVAPQIDPTEPLALELDDFANAIRRDVTPRSSHALGLEIVQVLEAAAASMAQGGRPIAVHTAREVAPVGSSARDRNGTASARVHAQA